MLVLDPAEGSAVLWRNGTGVTRELWIGEFARVSVADLTEDAAFSDSPGVDRVFVPLGRAITSGRRAGCHGEPPSPTRLRGETQVAARGRRAPSRALNVMTTRGKCHAEVRVVGRDDHPGADVTLAVHLGAHRADIRFLPASPPSSTKG